MSIKGDLVLEELLLKVQNSDREVEPVEDTVSIRSLKKYSSWVEGRGYLDAGEMTVHDLAQAASVDVKTIRNNIVRLESKGQWPYEKHMIEARRIVEIGVDRLKQSRSVRERYFKVDEVYHLLTHTILGRHWDPEQVFDDAEARKIRSAQLEEDLARLRRSQEQREAARNGRGRPSLNLPELNGVNFEVPAKLVTESPKAIASFNAEQRLIDLDLPKPKPKPDVIEVEVQDQPKSAESLRKHYDTLAQCVSLLQQRIWVKEDDLIIMLDLPSKYWMEGKKTLEVHGLKLESRMMGGFKYWTRQPESWDREMLE